MKWAGNDRIKKLERMNELNSSLDKQNYYLLELTYNEGFTRKLNESDGTMQFICSNGTIRICGVFDVITIAPEWLFKVPINTNKQHWFTITSTSGKSYTCRLGGDTAYPWTPNQVEVGTYVVDTVF